MKPQKTTTNEFNKAEALGQVVSAPALEEPIVEIEESIPEVADNPDDFRLMIGNAQMEQIEHIEVTERMFKHLLKNNKSQYLTYGSPGIKVYKVGTKKEIDKIEKMSAESYGNYIGRKLMDERKDVDDQ